MQFLFPGTCPRTNLPNPSKSENHRRTKESRNRMPPSFVCDALWSCLAPVDHRLVNFEWQCDDWLWRSRGIAISDDAGCCAITNRGLVMSKLGRYVEG